MRSHQPPERHIEITVTRPEYEDTTHYTGSEAAIDQEVGFVESLGFGHTIIEEDTYIPPYGKRHEFHYPYDLSTSDAMEPEELESTLLDTEMFARANRDPSSSSRLVSILNEIGVFTCADALALGSRQIVDWSKHVPGRRSSIGDQRIKTLSGALFRATGYQLSPGRSTPEAWLRFYNDIGEATPALALPTITFGWYGALKLRERETISSLRNARHELPYRTGLPLYMGDVFHDFVDNILKNEVIVPFNRARAGLGQYYG